VTASRSWTYHVVSTVVHSTCARTATSSGATSLSGSTSAYSNGRSGTSALASGSIGSKNTTPRSVGGSAAWSRPSIAETTALSSAQSSISTSLSDRPARGSVVYSTPSGIVSSGSIHTTHRSNATDCSLTLTR